MWSLHALLSLSTPFPYSVSFSQPLLPTVRIQDSDHCLPLSPQRLDQELTTSQGSRSAWDRAEVMAPPPVLPLASSIPILHGEFGSYPAHGPRFALTLTVQALHIQRLRPKPEARPRNGLVPLAEVSGCGTLQSRSPSDTAAYFCVYTYPRSRRGGRCRAIRTFRADGAATYEENRAEAQRWATALTCLLRGVPLSGEQGEMWGKSHIGVSVSFCVLVPCVILGLSQKSEVFCSWLYCLSLPGQQMSDSLPGV